MSKSLLQAASTYASEFHQEALLFELQAMCEYFTARAWKPNNFDATELFSLLLRTTSVFSDSARSYSAYTELLRSPQLVSAASEY